MNVQSTMPNLGGIIILFNSYFTLVVGTIHHVKLFWSM